MTRHRLLVVLWFASCASGVSTPVGEPEGPETRALIGAAGGQLVSEDRGLVVTVPAGALSGDVELSIARVNTNMPGGFKTYRLGPSGQKFAAPVTLAFFLTGEELPAPRATAPGAAFQAADGTWEYLEGGTFDAASRTYSVTTTHFTDFAAAERFRLLPVSANVKTSEQLSLSLTACGTGARALRCTSIASESGLVIQWEVNGQPNGSATLGTVSGGAQATYTAPAIAPRPATVAVSARLSKPGVIEVVLVAEVTIGDPPNYAGTIDAFSAPAILGPVTGSGTVSWFQLEDGPDVVRYVGGGVLAAHFAPVDCDPIDTTLEINPGPLDAEESVLVVFKENNYAHPSRYHFGLATVPKELTLCCGTPRSCFTVSHTVSLGPFACVDGFNPATYSDRLRLKGGFACGTSQQSVSWNFVRSDSPTP